MKKVKTILIVLFIGLFSRAFSGEGMWTPLLLQQLNEAEMQAMGLKLTAEDIYSINQASLKDAIVIFGGGCTGEIISSQGLLLTNHHCGYGRIQEHSSVEHNYLQDGFWAQNKEEELKNPGLTAKRLVRMEDVTDRALSGITDDMEEEKRKEILDENIKIIKEEASKDSEYDFLVKPFYYGNEYYLIVYEVFKDIRLVGAPPSSVGKFGADTDNWMWPRHAADFSLFRIYVDENNQAAEYAEDNVPYKPLKHLEVSLEGVNEGDFTFIFGYPGRTQEYLPSQALEMITKSQNPIRISIRDTKLKTMKKYMEQSPKTRLQYATKYARVENGYKKWKGENRGIKKLEAVQKKKNFETDFIDWAKNKSEYSDLTRKFEKTYQELEPLNASFFTIYETYTGIEIAKFANAFSDLTKLNKKEPLKKEELIEKIQNLKDHSKSFFKDYHKDIDREMLEEMLKLYIENTKHKKPEIFSLIQSKFKNDYQAYSDFVFKKSMFDDEEKVKDLLNNFSYSDAKKITKDPAYILAQSFLTTFRDELAPKRNELNSKLDQLQRVYMKAQKEMKPMERFYPDANFTLRIAYGYVDDYMPRDGVNYKHFTTLQGVMEKENPDVYDYKVSDKLKELYKTKDYGHYADKDGKMHLCFTASNHTTGGNSGSPVLNAEGQLIGINFDRNWEGTMSDLMYDPDQCRNISLDIRYCLFIIDKFAGAKHLIDEMTIVNQ